MAKLYARKEKPRSEVIRGKKKNAWRSPTRERKPRVAKPYAVGKTAWRSYTRVHFFLNCKRTTAHIGISLTCILPTRASTSSVSESVSPEKDGVSVARAFEQECVGFFAEVVHIFGVPKSVGQIYGILYASPLPLSFSDIVEKLEISKGSASQGLALLRSLGAINVADATLYAIGDKQKAQASGSKDGARSGERPNAFSLPLSASDVVRSARITFEPELSLRRLVSGVLKERIAPMAATGTERLARMRKLAEQDGLGNEFYLDRAKQLNSWRKRLKTVLPVLTALLGPKTRK